MISNVTEIFSMLKKYRSGVVVTQKINSPTMCLDFDQSVNPDSEWFTKGRFHNCSPYISSITEIVNNVPYNTENDRIQNLQNAPKTAALLHTPSTQYFLKENYLIMIFHKNRVTSYPYTEHAARKLGLSLAPVLFKGKLESDEHLKSLIHDYESLNKDKSSFLNKTSESISNLVVRPLGSFTLEEYSNNVFEL